MTTSNQNDTSKVLITDFANKGMWTQSLNSYLFWFEYLVLSPSYELARRYCEGELTSNDSDNLPADFDQVLAVYEDFGDVLRKNFFGWWRERGMALCATGGQKPDVSVVTGLRYLDHLRSAPQEKVDDYINEEWLREGSQNTILVAIPIGLSKSRITRRINSILDQFPKAAKKLQHREPTYPLTGKRENEAMLFRYYRVLTSRAADPKRALWRIGAETGVSDTYSNELDSDAILERNEAYYDRTMLAILTSRAFKRGLLISENAARGVFPSYAPCSNAVTPDLNEMSQRFDLRQP